MKNNDVEYFMRSLDKSSRNKRRKKKKNFKKCLYKAGIITAVLANVVSYNVGKNSNKKEQKESYDNGYSVGYEKGSKDTTITLNKINEISNNEVVADKDQVVNYVLTFYNGLGNNLSREDLGLIECSPTYLYNDTNLNQYVLDNERFNVLEEYKEIKEEDKNSVYIYVDKSKSSKPIAGITVVNDKYANVRVNSYSGINNENTIRMDKNNYVNFSGLTDEEMKLYFDGTLDYLEERKSKIK